MLLGAGDPPPDLGASRHVAPALTQGRVVDPSKVYRDLGRRPFVVDGAAN
jgi:hypothetical protein